MSRLSLSTPPNPRLVASIIAPARNEAPQLTRFFAPFLSQVDVAGTLLDLETLELILLVNNSTDDSFEVAREFALAHPELALHVIEEEFAPCEADIGHVRRALMELACSRLEQVGSPDSLILSTDADTEIAPDWIARNFQEIAHGVQAVGGLIRLLPDSFAALPAETQQMRTLDDRYHTLVAWLEHACDPIPHDPWPRHYHHFGSSFAVNPKAYRAVGGIAPEPVLEDLAFYRRLLKHDLLFRHSPDVIVHTSARLSGRIAVGLSDQLTRWTKSDCDAAQAPVQRVADLQGRFVMRKTFRDLWRENSSSSAKREAFSRRYDLAPQSLDDGLSAGFFGAGWEHLEAQLPSLGQQPLSNAIEELERLMVLAKASETPAGRSGTFPS